MLILIKYKYFDICLIICLKEDILIFFLFLELGNIIRMLFRDKGLGIYVMFIMILFFYL